MFWTLPRPVDDSSVVVCSTGHSCQSMTSIFSPPNLLELTVWLQRQCKSPASSLVDYSTLRNRRWSCYIQALKFVHRLQLASSYTPPDFWWHKVFFQASFFHWKMNVKVRPHYAVWHKAAKCGKSCTMPQVYVDVASAWLWHAVWCCGA